MSSIEKRERGDGSSCYVVRYRDPSGGSRSKTFARRIDAERYRTSIESSKLTGQYVDPARSRVTVGAWADLWLDAQTDLAPKTRERYEGILSRHIRPRWGSTPLASVTHAEVQRWLSRLELAPASVRKTHRVLSMALAYAVKDGRLAINPAAGVSLPRVQQTERLFLAYTGLRWGEMAALRVRRVDFLRRRPTHRRIRDTRTRSHDVWPDQGTRAARSTTPAFPGR
jgi:integrase